MLMEEDVVVSVKCKSSSCLGEKTDTDSLTICFRFFSFRIFYLLYSESAVEPPHSRALINSPCLFVTLLYSLARPLSKGVIRMPRKALYCLLMCETQGKGRLKMYGTLEKADILIMA